MEEINIKISLGPNVQRQFSSLGIDSQQAPPPPEDNQDSVFEGDAPPPPGESNSVEAGDTYHNTNGTGHFPAPPLEDISGVGKGGSEGNAPAPPGESSSGSPGPGRKDAENKEIGPPPPAVEEESNSPAPEAIANKKVKGSSKSRSRSSSGKKS